MLDLSSPRWKKLSQAYGSAEGIPALLIQLKTAPLSESYQSEPCNSLCGSLCHQSDSYTASYAAVPHIIHLGPKRPVSERFDSKRLRPREKFPGPFLVRRGIPRDAWGTFSFPRESGAR